MPSPVQYLSEQQEEWIVQQQMSKMFPMNVVLNYHDDDEDEEEDRQSTYSSQRHHSNSCWSPPPFRSHRESPQLSTLSKNSSSDVKVPDGSKREPEVKNTPPTVIYPYSEQAKQADENGEQPMREKASRPGKHAKRHKLTWSQQYENLQYFVVLFGHANVPRNFTPNLRLANWVHRQRLRYKYPNKYGSLTATQIFLLRKLKVKGFETRGPLLPVWPLQPRPQVQRALSSVVSHEEDIGIVPGKISPKPT